MSHFSKVSQKPKTEKLALIGLNDCYVVSLGEEEFFQNDVARFVGFFQ